MSYLEPDQNQIWVFKNRNQNWNYNYFFWKPNSIFVCQSGSGTGTDLIYFCRIGMGSKELPQHWSFPWVCKTFLSGKQRAEGPNKQINKQQTLKRKRKKGCTFVGHFGWGSQSPSKKTHHSTMSVPEDDDDGEGAAKLQSFCWLCGGGIQTCVVCKYYKQ